MLAGALGVGAHYLANLPGRTGQPILLVLFVFLLGKYKYKYYVARYLTSTCSTQMFLEIACGLID